MENEMKKTFSLLLTLCMLLGLMPMSAYAAESGTASGEVMSDIYTVIPEEGTLPDSDEILDSYAQQVMYPQYSISMFSLGPDRLGERQQHIYDELKKAIESIAGGTSLSCLELSYTSADSPLVWTYEELGVSAGDSTISNKLFEKMDIKGIHDYLVMDLPFDLYWYDKTVDGGMKTLLGYTPVENGVAVTTLKFAFSVSPDFRQTDTAQKVQWVNTKEMYAYKVNNSKVLAANNAAVNARSIVAANEDLSDYEKLLAYKDEICKLTSYNKDAVAEKDPQYGDPWQLVYVFDGDPNTKVVCEGYSKAFQYLCDLSEFEDAACYTATGEVQGALSNPEGHMWNIVSLKGSNYLVDVTNSDEGTIGNKGQLFLAGASGDASGGHTVNVNGSDVRYTYGEDQIRYLGKLLVLSTTSYSDEPTEHQHVWSDAWSSDENNHWHECTAEGCDKSEKGDVAAHSWDEGKVTKEPTESETGVKTYTCTVCNATKTETLPVLTPGHTHVWSEAWSTDGSHHWHECTVDGCTVTDNSQKDGYGEHNYGEDNVCDTCGYTKPVEHEHSWPDEWEKDENNHWKNCLETSCGAVDIYPHEWDEGTVTKEPSTTEKGIKTYKCKVCGYEKQEDIAMLEHQHSWSGDWTKNDQFHWHDCTAAGCTLTDNSKKSGFGEHKFDNGTVTKEATTTSAGTKEYKCTVCGYVKTEQIPILPTPQHDHVWSNAWTYNSTHHWHDCTASGCTVTNTADKYGYAAHSFGAWRTVKAATATTDGLMEHQCSCGYKETKTIPASGVTTEHQHSWSGWTFTSPNYWERTCSTCNARDIKIVEVAQPKIVSGAGAVWRQGSSNGLSFTSDAPVSEFKSVMLNGFTLSSTYYTVTEGSTIVTLKKSCLDQLGVGTHTLAIVSDGGTAQTTFTVKSKTIINNQAPTYNSSNPWSTPKTGDSANMGLWIGMIAVCVVGMGAVAVFVIKKNKRK